MIQPEFPSRIAAQVSVMKCHPRRLFRSVQIHHQEQVVRWYMVQPRKTVLEHRFR